MEPLLNAKQATDLTGLLTAVSEQPRLGRGYRDEAGYWASHVEPALDVDDAQTIAWLLNDVAGSRWLPGHMEQWARAWAASLEELTEGGDGSLTCDDPTGCGESGRSKDLDLEG